MALIYVTSANPGEGKTGVAAAIARSLAYAGSPVRLVRIQDGDGSHAAADAKWFASLDFAPGSPAEVQAEVPPGGAAETIIAEGPAASAPPDAKVVLVARGKRPGSLPAGTAAVVVTAVSGLQGAQAIEGSPIEVRLGDDRTLAGFSISEAKAALDAEVLVEGEEGDPTSDHLVIAPIGADAGQPYFRRFESKAVVVRFDKTDQHLAAIRGRSNVLILTGGKHPSANLVDAATSSGVPVLLSAADTESTVAALDGIFDGTRFQGGRKLDRMAALLAGTGLAESLS